MHSPLMLKYLLVYARLKMSMETLTKAMVLLLKPTSIGRHRWLHLLIQVFPGLCASKRMHPIQLYSFSFQLSTQFYAVYVLLDYIFLAKAERIGLCVHHTVSFYYLHDRAILPCLYAHRLMRAMDFTAINSRQTRTRNQKCGLRIGLDGQQ